MQVISFGPRPVLGSETVTVDATAGGVALTATKYQPALRSGDAAHGPVAKATFITVEDASIRVNFDPTVTVTATTNGHVFTAGDSFEVHGQALANFRAIRTGGTSGTLRVTYFG